MLLPPTEPLKHRLHFFNSDGERLHFLEAMCLYDHRYPTEMKSANALKAARTRNRRKARYIISADPTRSLGKFAYPPSAGCTINNALTASSLGLLRCH